MAALNERKIDLAGIGNVNEYYSSHYFVTRFDADLWERIQAQKEGGEALSLAGCRRAYGRAAAGGRVHSARSEEALEAVTQMADAYLQAFGYPEAEPEVYEAEGGFSVPVYLEVKKPSGAPHLWAVLVAPDGEAGIEDCEPFGAGAEEGAGRLFCERSAEELAGRVFFSMEEPPRFLLYIGLDQIALLDRNKWNEKRYLRFEMKEIFARAVPSTQEAAAALLHKGSLCPAEGRPFLDDLDENSLKNAAGVSQELKYALRESIEILGNEVLHDMRTRLGRDMDADPVDAGELTVECLRYMYRMLFILFIEARPELGYAPMKERCYGSGYSLESLREIAAGVNMDAQNAGDGYFMNETLNGLYRLFYEGYPVSEEEYGRLADETGLHDVFRIAP